MLPRARQVYNLHAATAKHTNIMITLGIIVGNRGFFPAHLCDTGRKEILALLEKLGLRTVTLPVSATKFGAVESMEDAQKCADLFKQKAERIN